MTDNEKYIELLKELGELIMQKNIYISTREYQIKSLERRLEIAEKQLEEQKNKDKDKVGYKVSKMLDDIVEKHGKDI